MAEEIINDNKKRIRDEESSESCDSPVEKRLRDDLLDMFEDSELGEGTQDLASVMKSFEEEITTSNQLVPEHETEEVSSKSSESGELGYLFEASDDELGLPPAFSEEEDTNSGKQEQEDEKYFNLPSEYEQMWRFEDEIPSYDFGIGDSCDNNGEFLALDGLFDYSDVYSAGQSDYSDFFYRPESLPAL